MGQDSRNKKSLDNYREVAVGYDNLSAASSRLHTLNLHEDYVEYVRLAVTDLQEASEYILAFGKARERLIAENVKLQRVIREQVHEYAGDREKLVTLRCTKEMGTDELWYWMGDEHDSPESLSCPVVMQPEDVRNLTRKIDRLEAENLVLKEAL